MRIFILVAVLLLNSCTTFSIRDARMYRYPASVNPKEPYPVSVSYSDFQEKIHYSKVLYANPDDSEWRYFDTVEDDENYLVSTGHYKNLAEIKSGKSRLPPYRRRIIENARAYLKAWIAIDKDRSGSPVKDILVAMDGYNLSSDNLLSYKLESWMKYTGYSLAGHGVDPCTDKIDPLWGIDCSGLVNLVYKMSGLCFPYMDTKTLWLAKKDGTSNLYENAMSGDRITVLKYFEVVEDPLPGDLVVVPHHTGIYIDDNLMIQAQSGVRGLNYGSYKPRDLNADDGTDGKKYFYLRYRFDRAPDPAKTLNCRVGSVCQNCRATEPVAENVWLKSPVAYKKLLRNGERAIVGRDASGGEKTLCYKK